MRKLFQYAALALIFALNVSCTHKTEAPKERKSIIVIHNLSHQHVTFYQFMAAIEDAFPDTSAYKIDYAAVTEAYHPWPNEDFSGLLMQKLDIIQKKWDIDMLVLYSDQVLHAAARCHHPLLDSLPVVFMGATWPEHEGLLENRKNFTGYRTPLGIKPALDLMRDMGCNPWTIVNLDSTYLDRYLREEIACQLGDTSLYVTNLDYSAADHLIPDEERDHSKSTIIPVQLRCSSASGFDATKMLNCSESGCSYLKIKDDRAGITSVSNPVGIFYSVTPERFNLSHHSAFNACAGGCFVPFGVMIPEVRTMIDEILVEGKRPEDIPWRTMEPDIWLDWKILKNDFSFGSKLPRYAHVVNLPWKERNLVNSIISDYWIGILTLMVFICLMSVALYLFLANQARSRDLIGEGQAAEKMTVHMEEALAAANCHFFRIRRTGSILFDESFRELCGTTPVPANAEQFAEMLSPEKRMEFLDIITDNELMGTVRSLNFDFLGHHFNAKIVSNHGSGQADKAYGILFNMDTYHQIERQKNEAFKIEEQSTMKRAFLASMGHEIRTPLNAILGYSRLLFDMYDDLDNEEKSTYSEVIRQNSEQLLSLIDNVLTFSSKEGREPDIVLSRKKVSDLLDEIYMTYRVIVPAHLQFILEKGNDDEYVMVNRGSMLQVLSNIMNNAVKFTAEGSITLGWRNEGDDVVIYVKDTGCGIPEESLGSIFEKYSKVRASTEGAGIGLALCKRLVDKMKGRIRVSSTLGSGSCFQVIFKRVAPEIN